MRENNYKVDFIIGVLIFLIAIPLMYFSYSNITVGNFYFFSLFFIPLSILSVYFTSILYRFRNIKKYITLRDQVVNILKKANVREDMLMEISNDLVLKKINIETLHISSKYKDVLKSIIY